MDTPRTALVTGASAGIGAAFAELLAEKGMHLVLTARREHKLEELAERLRADHGVRCDVVAADLADSDAPRRLFEQTAELGVGVDVLVNNAGYSGSTAFLETEWESLAAEIQVMVTAVTELSRRFAPGMVERGWGRIVNVSSVAALLPPTESLLYTALKRFVHDHSQALDMELKPHGVHVTALCPGFTRSEFHAEMGITDLTDKLPGLAWQQPRDVVEEGWAAVERGKPVCVTGRVNKALAASMRPVPQALRYRVGRAANPF